MKFGLDDIWSEVLEGLGHMSFHAMFYTVGENDGNRNKRSGVIKIQPSTA